MSQSHEHKFNLTVGSIFSKLLIVAVPVMGTQLMQMSYNLTNMFWLGRLSTSSVAASGTAGLYLWLSMSLLMFGRMGAEIGVSQDLGWGDKESAQAFGENAFMLSIVLGLIVMLAMYAWRTPLVGFFNIQEADIVAQAESYLGIVSFGVPLSFSTAAMVGCFTASGNTRMPFFVNAIGLAVNMVLDPIMIFLLHMGIEGAAIATVIAQACAFALMAAAIRRAKARPFKRFRYITIPNPRSLLQIVKWSWPIGAESALFTFMTMITSRLISPFGGTALAVGRVGSQIESLSWLIGGGYGSALTSFMGQNFGAGKWTRIRRGFRISMVVMGVWGVAVTTFMCTLGGPVFWMFLPDPAVKAMGITYLQILAACQIPQCFEAVAAATFRGCGKTLPPSISSVSTNILRVLMALLFVRTWGAFGVWAAISLSAAMRGIITLVWYLKEARQQPKEDIVQTAALET